MSSKQPEPSGTELALWGTQGGGLARWDDHKSVYVWHELPDWYAESGIQERVGDPIPAEWGLAPANESARNDMQEGEAEDLF